MNPICKAKKQSLSFFRRHLILFRLRRRRKKNWINYENYAWYIILQRTMISGIERVPITDNYRRGCRIARAFFRTHVDRTQSSCITDRVEEYGKSNSGNLYVICVDFDEGEEKPF